MKAKLAALVVTALLAAGPFVYAQDAATATEKAAKKTGSGIKKGVKGTGHEVKKGAEKTADAVK